MPTVIDKETNTIKAMNNLEIVSMFHQLCEQKVNMAEHNSEKNWL